MAWIQDFIMLPDCEMSACGVDTWEGIGWGSQRQTKTEAGKLGYRQR